MRFPTSSRYKQVPDPMKRTAYWLLCLLALLLWPAGGLLAQGALEGHVRDAATGQSLAGVQIFLPELGTGGITDSEGHYELAGIPAGARGVEIRLIGYHAERREVVISDGQTTHLDMVLGQEVIALEGVVAIGSRARPRTVTESMVPIDAIPPADIVDQGDTDVADLLRTVVPSFNINPQATGDAAKIIRPANLRGLAPDHTLVLVNGKRRHRAAAILWIGNGTSDGAQGPDLSSIPAIALRQIEVLRDGASAQYGSDAIAGVMNFQLRNDRSGGAVEARGGGFADGGGEAWTLAGNVGLPLSGFGFANLSAEYGNSASTSRTVQRSDAALLTSAGNPHVRNPAQIWGSPKVEDDFKLWGNFGYLLHGGTQFYGHANYASKRVTGGFFFRNPNTRAAVFSIDGGETLLIGDALDARDGVADGSAGCPTVRVNNGRPDQAALAQVFADPNCFTYQEMFPGGFTPQFGADVTDASLVAGVKGQTAGGLLWDASASYGSNEVDFFIFNTVNASLGPATPDEFDPGLYRQREVNVNVDLSYAASDMVNLAGGAEWRDEHFTIGLGQEESWIIGPYAGQGFSAGSNGFPGFSPIAAGDWSRANYALYADAELLDPREGRWNVGGALRFEDFEDFGAALNGKLAARFALAEGFALRGSLSTGFRAPTPGQQNAFNVSTQFDRQLRDLVNNGTIPSTSRVAALRGGEPLGAEKSRNMALGAVIGAGPLQLTADYYHIRVSDRLALTQNFELTPAEKAQLVAEGISSATNLQNFRFFTNDFQTRTQGIDVVATYTPPASSGTEISFAFNRTGTRVSAFDPEVVNDTRILQLEDGLPGYRWLVTAKHPLGDVRLLARISYYDGWFDSRDDLFYNGDYLVDLEASYSLGEAATVTIGGQNALNNYPEENPNAVFSGNRYSPNSPFGSNGGFFYLRLGYRLD